MVVFLSIVVAVIVFIVFLSIKSSRKAKAAKKLEEELLGKVAQGDSQAKIDLAEFYLIRDGVNKDLAAKVARGDSQAKIDLFEFYISRCGINKELVTKVSQGDSNSIMALADKYKDKFLKTSDAYLERVISLYERIIEHGNVHHVSAINRALDIGAFDNYRIIRMCRSMLTQDGYNLGDYNYHRETESISDNSVSYVCFDVSDSAGAKCGEIFFFNGGFKSSHKQVARQVMPNGSKGLYEHFNARGSHHVICLKSIPIIIKSNTPCIDPPADWMIACARILAVSYKTLSYPDWASECRNPEEFINVAFQHLEQ
ncbi:MAG: hypothetical protein FWB79_00755 [Treponema sp.]|nr:hypothetical protein [Treponema sp.]